MMLSCRNIDLGTSVLDLMSCGCSCTSSPTSRQLLFGNCSKKVCRIGGKSYGGNLVLLRRDLGSCRVVPAKPKETFLVNGIGQDRTVMLNLKPETQKPVSLETLFDVVADDLQRLNDNLLSIVGAENPVLISAAEQIFSAGGKRMRPGLVFLVSRATAELAGLKELTVEHRRLGEIIEMIHTASLIHDDVLDESDMRRGKETVHELFGTRVAVLAGDFMFAQASWYLANLENLEVIKLISQVIKDFASGEIKQASSLFDCDVELDDYLLKSYYKTASLVAASTKGAAIFSNVESEIAEQMYQFGKRRKSPKFPMRTSGDVYGADAGSSRNDEERVFKEDLSDCSSPMRNRQNDSNSQPGSQRFVNSLRKDEETRNNPIQPTDQQQAELLRKLDSLKGHVLRGGGNNPNVVDLPPPPQGFHAHGLPSYYNPHPEPFSYGIYPTHVPPYGNPYGFPMHRTPQNFYPGPGHYPNQIPPRPPFPQGQYVDIGPDLFDPQLQDPRFFPVTPSTYGDVPYSPVVHHGEKIGPFSPHGGVQGHHHTRWPSEIEYEMGGGGQGHHTRWPSEIESEMGGGGGGQVHHTRWPSEIDSKMGGGAFAQGHVQKATYDSRRCYPLAGGAPFIACHNCFELLYLPKKKILAQERQQKLQCGACSEVTSFKIVDKKLVFCSSALEETTNQVSVEVEDRSATTAAVDDYPRTHRKTKSVQDASPSVHSDDEERLSISSEPQKQVVKSVRHRAKGTKAPPPPPENSNLLELFEYSNVNRAALTYGMAQLGYNKQESYAKQDSLKPESVATETDVSYNEYYNNNTDVSEDSRISKTSKGEIRPRHRKESSEYSLPEVTNEIISHDLDNEQLEVWVNGHLIPEDLVISAEKLAGPVQAGKYWYDYRAGFWGVMGNPCLGIIPPFIEEFSRPMPDNCGAGNTSVFVNGRELHERDLELLSRRGLPREKNRSYIVDISGRVLDGDSGEELKSLGRLAPTVDKVKHGFGMRVPRSLMSSA